jgi:death-on-curing protein
LADLRQVLAEFHDRTISEHGGFPGIRDQGVFELCVARPWMTGFGELLYKTPFQQAAAIADAIVRNHPFNDGNHRSALAAAYVVLGLNDIMLVALDHEQQGAIIKLETGAVGIDEFSAWLEQKSVLRSRPN